MTSSFYMACTKIDGNNQTSENSQTAENID